MSKYQVWRVSIVKEVVNVKADTLKEALDRVSENSDEFEFEFIDADTTYTAEEM